MPSSPASRPTGRRSPPRSRRRQGRQPMIGTAWAADAAGEHGGIFSDPAFWVARRLRAVLRAGRQAPVEPRLRHARQALGDIARALADAERLRDEALKAKQEAERTLAPGRDRGRRHPPAGARGGRAHAGPGRGQPEERRGAARAAGARPHRPVRGGRRQAGARHRRRRGAVGHPRAVARAGRLGPQRRPWSTRRSASCRSACTEFFDFELPA